MNIIKMEKEKQHFGLMIKYIKHIIQKRLLKRLLKEKV
jgi:hypothetical protein